MIGLREQIPKGMAFYEFIKQELKRDIDTGVLKEGDRVPSELELARYLNVSRSQTRLALRDLEMSGYLLRSPGRGSFVAPASNRAKQLSMRGFRMVAMASADFYSVYRRRVIESFSEHILDAGFRMLTYFLRLHDERELEFLEQSRNTGIEGLAFWIQDRSDAAKAVLTAFRESLFPCVLCDRYLPGFDIDFAATDNVDIGYRLTRALIRQGHRHIGFMTLWLGMTPTEDRLEGYRRALAEAGLPFEEGLVGSLDSPGESSTSLVKGVLAHRRRPTAMFCTDDRVVKTVIEVIKRLGYSLPDDMAFASVDDDDSFRDFEVPVLYACQNAEEIGRQTADLLVARIRDPRKEIESRFIRAQFFGLGEAESGATRDVTREGGDAGPVRQECAVCIDR